MTNLRFICFILDGAFIRLRCWKCEQTAVVSLSH